MKSILYLTRGGLMGGSQRQLYYLLTNLQRDYEPIVVSRNNGQFLNTLQDHGITTYVLPMHNWRKFPDALFRYWDAERVVHYARKHNVALVHSSDLWLSGYMRWVAGRLKIPSVLHVRTPISTDNVHKHNCDKADAIIAISRRIRRNLLISGVTRTKITHINDSVNLNEFKPQDSGEKILKKDFALNGNVMVGIVGRIDPLKHQMEFLQAAEKTLKISAKSTTFFIVGEVHHPGYFEQLKKFISEKGLDKHVVFTGRREDMPQVLNSLDVLVSFSGGSIMFEAAACGKAVISAGLNGGRNSASIKYLRFRPIVSATGSSRLIEALAGLINDSEFRKRLGREARKWAQNSFCHVAMATKTQKLYEKLLR